MATAREPCRSDLPLPAYRRRRRPRPSEPPTAAAPSQPAAPAIIAIFPAFLKLQLAPAPLQDPRDHQAN